MHVDSIRDGIVIDHIKAGTGMKLYSFLNLGSLGCSIAVILNVPSKKMCRKDIIKIDANISLDLDAIGYIDPGITVDIIKNGELVEKKHLELPDTIKGIVKCKNPRCICTTEQELEHIFKLTDRENKIYRCVYCESKADTRND